MPDLYTTAAKQALEETFGFLPNRTALWFTHGGF